MFAFFLSFFALIIIMVIVIITITFITITIMRTCSVKSFISEIPVGVHERTSMKEHLV